MYNSIHTDSISTSLSSFNNSGGEINKKIAQNGKKPGLKGKIFHIAMYLKEINVRLV